MSHAKRIAWLERIARDPRTDGVRTISLDDLTAAIAALRECDEAREQRPVSQESWSTAERNQMSDEIGQLKSQLSALKAEAAKVIEPFARLGDLSVRAEKENGCRPNKNAAMFRAAHAFHARLQDKGGTDG